MKVIQMMIVMMHVDLTIKSEKLNWGGQLFFNEMTRLSKLMRGR